LPRHILRDFSATVEMTPPYWGGVPCGDVVGVFLKITALDPSVNLEDDKGCRCLGNGVDDKLLWACIPTIAVIYQYCRSQ
jgi:hypothetical protein